MMFLAKITVFFFFVCLSAFLYDVKCFFNCSVSVIGCCGKCCSCCVVVFLSIYKFKILVFCFGGWFISAYL